MSFLDKAKQAFGTAKDKAGELATEHGDKIDSAIDKGGSFIDQKTHGKDADKVAKGDAHRWELDQASSEDWDDRD